MCYPLAAGKQYLDQISTIIEQEDAEVFSDLAESGRGGICRVATCSHCKLAVNLARYLSAESTSLEKMAITAVRDRLKLRLSQPHDYAKEHLEQFPIPDSMIKAGYKFTDAIIEKFPVSEHKYLMLGRQCLLLNACLENRLQDRGREADFRDSVFPRPVMYLKGVVKSCLDKDGSCLYRDRLDAVFDKIMPEKSKLEGKKLIIIRPIVFYSTMGLVLDHFKSYLDCRGIDFCFCMSLPKNVQGWINENYPKHVECEKTYFFYLQDKESNMILDMYVSKSDFYYLDVVNTPDDMYLSDSVKKIWSFTENPLHSVFAAHIRQSGSHL